MGGSLFPPFLIVKQPSARISVVFHTVLRFASFSFRFRFSLRVACYSQPGTRMEPDIQFMQVALEEARAAAEAGEVPIGAVLVFEGKILARSNNRTIRDTDPTAHAEIVVLREASKLIGNYRLSATTLYVT